MTFHDLFRFFIRLSFAFASRERTLFIHSFWTWTAGNNGHSEHTSFIIFLLSLLFLCTLLFLCALLLIILFFFFLLLLLSWLFYSVSWSSWRTRPFIDWSRSDFIIIDLFIRRVHCVEVRASISFIFDHLTEWRFLHVSPHFYDAIGYRFIHSCFSPGHRELTFFVLIVSTINPSTYFFEEDVM